MLRIILFAVAGLVALVAIALVMGMMLPKAHTAAIRVRMRQPPERVYDAITDVAHGASWRTGLKSVQVTSLPGAPLTWNETGDWGTMSYALDLVSPPHRVSTRMTDTSQGFGGGWTFEVAPDSRGTLLTITENGEVYNPMFRFMSKYVFGQYKSIETYARDLGRHFNETVQPERITR